MFDIIRLMAGAESESHVDLKTLLYEHPDLIVIRGRSGDFGVIRKLSPWSSLVMNLNQPNRGGEFGIAVQSVMDHKWSDLTHLMIKPVNASENRLKVINPKSNIDPQQIISDVIHGIEIFDAYLQDSNPEKGLDFWQRIQDQTQITDYPGHVRPQETGGYWTAIGKILQNPFISTNNGPI